MEKDSKITSILNEDILNMLNTDKTKEVKNKNGGGHFYGKKHFELNSNSKCSSKKCILNIDNNLIN